MTIIYVQHRVADYDAWRRVYDSVGEIQRQGGVISEAVYRADGDPNLVLVMHEFANSAQARAFVESPELRGALQDSGVDVSSLRVEFYEQA